MLKGFTFLVIISAFLLLVSLVVYPVLPFIPFVDEKNAPANIVNEIDSGTMGEAERAVKEKGDGAAKDLIAATNPGDISTANFVRLVAAAVSGGATQGLQP